MLRRFLKIVVCATVFILLVSSWQIGESEERHYIMAVQPNDSFALINKDGEYLTPPCFRYDSRRDRKGYTWVNKNGKWGCINREGKFVVDFKYDEFSWRSYEGGKNRVKLDGKWGIVSDCGEEIIECRYDEIKGISEGRVTVKSGGKWGYLDTTGKKVTDCVFDDAGEFRNGYAAVQKEGKWGYINTNGEQVINFLFDDTDSFSEGLFGVKKGDNWGYIDKHSNVVIDFQYFEANMFENGRAKVVIRLKDAEFGKYQWQVVDGTGKVIRASEPYSRISESWNRGDFVYCDGKGEVGFYDSQQNIMINGDFDWVEEFHANRATVKKKGSDKVSVIDSCGNEIFEVEDVYGDNPYHSYRPDFSDNCTPACISKAPDGKRTFAYLDKDGKKAFDTEFSVYWAAPFSHGYALLQSYTTGEFQVIDRTGTITATLKNISRIFRFSDESVAIFSQNDRYGYVKPDGSFLYPPVFVHAKSFSNGVAWVVTDDHFPAILHRDGSINLLQREEGTRKVDAKDLDYGVASHRSPRERGLPVAEVDEPKKEKDDEEKPENQVTIPTIPGIEPERFNYSWFCNDMSFVRVSAHMIISTKEPEKPIAYCCPLFGFSEGLIPVKLSEAEKGYMNEEGKVVLRGEYEETFPFSEGRAVIKAIGGYYVIDREGNTIGGPYRECKTKMFFDGRLVVGEKGPDNSMFIRFINRDCKQILAEDGSIAKLADLLGSRLPRDIRKKFYYSGYISDGLVAVQPEEEGLFGFADKLGKIVIEPRFTFVGVWYEEMFFPPLHFKDGVCPVEIEGSFGAINKKGELIVPAKYSDVGLNCTDPGRFAKTQHFVGDFCAVKREREWGIVSRKGEEVIPCKYEYILDYNDDIVVLARNDTDEEDIPWNYDRDQFHDRDCVIEVIRISDGKRMLPYVARSIAWRDVRVDYDMLNWLYSKEYKRVD